MLDALAQSPLAQAISSSRQVYPLLNAAHIAALASLFGSILALDLRLVGLFRAVPILPLAQVLPRVSACGLVMAVLTGFMLFLVEPHDYAANGAFRAKLALVATGAIHALAVHRSSAWQALVTGGRIGAGLRLSGALSLAIWTSAIVAGRLIAF